MKLFRFCQSRIVSSVIIFVFTAQLLSSCSPKLTKGNFINVERIEDTKKLVSTDYKIEILKKPTPEQPTAKFKITKILSFTYETYAKYKTKAEYKDRMLASGLGGFLLIASLIVGNKKNAPEVDTGTTIMAATGAGLLASGFYIKNKTDRKIERQPFFYADTTLSKPVEEILTPKSEEILAQIGETQRNFTLNDSGCFVINFPNDFGLVSFKNPQDLNLIVKTQDKLYTENFIFNSLDWTIPYARATKKGNLFSEKDSLSYLLGSFAKDEEFKIIQGKPDWIKVSFQGREVWVSDSEVERIWKPQVIFDPTKPPKISATLSFADSSKNGLLEADERGFVKIHFKNDSNGNAYRLKAKITPNKIDGLNFESEIEIGEVFANREMIFDFPISATKFVNSKVVNFKISFEEASGFEPPQTEIQFETRKFVAPKLELTNLEFSDSDGNNEANSGEVIQISATVRNTGKGLAKNTNVILRLGKDTFFTQDSKKSFSFGNLLPNESRKINFTVYTNLRAEDLPVFVELNEFYGLYGKPNIKIPIPFSKTEREVQKVVVEAKPEILSQNSQQKFFAEAPKHKLAILFLEPQTKSLSRGEAMILTEILTSEFSQKDIADLVERAQIDKILKEWHFQVSECVDEGICRDRIGELTGANKILIGSVGNLGNENSWIINARIVDVYDGSLFSVSEKCDCNIEDLDKAVKALSNRLSDWLVTH
ncbi:MAG: hypothetical protein DWQ06_10210 [Calditrichaeota bacterium]|nr:MAG: hypothetical protein DWQ06_10210 [Calditrichota bacterium]